MADDPFSGSFENDQPRDPAHKWYKDDPMSPDRLAQVLTEVLKERGVENYLIRVELINQSSQGKKLR